jgi:hypothetical protein
MSKNGKGYMSGSNGEDQTSDAVSPPGHRSTAKLPHQNSHSNTITLLNYFTIGVGRDLQGMGLITQVKQGEDKP